MFRISTAGQYAPRAALRSMFHLTAIVLLLITLLNLVLFPAATRAAVPAQSSSGGSIFLSGQDPDFHGYYGANNLIGAQNYLRAATSFVMDPEHNTFVAAGVQKFLLVDASTLASAAYSASGYPGSAFDRHSAATLNGALDQLGTTYSALVVASDFGGTLTQAELNVLNARASDIIEFLNDGGGLFAMSENNLGGAYGFLPFVAASLAVGAYGSGIDVSPYGEALGLTDADANNNYYHTVFLETSGLEVIETAPDGKYIALAGRGTVDPDDGVITEPTDPDQDSDGAPDTSDNCPAVANADQLNSDGDAQGNACDADDDNDGFSDVEEATLGTNPLLADSDGDGTPDNRDAFPTNPGETRDADFDGTGDNADLDDDNDGLNDAQEATLGTDPFDTDSDNDGVNDSEDAFPLDASESVDTDGDGTGDSADLDDDNDGLSDAQEATLGTDPLDVDTDNDGVIDSRDAMPVNPAESSDNDGDGIGNNADGDDDNDNVPDSSDPFPLVKDTTKPEITLVATPFEIWPPNHKYVALTIDDFVLAVTDETDGSLNTADVTITKVTSDEAEDAPGNGDGSTLADIVIGGSGRSVNVRSERQGAGNGRVYTIHVTVTDRSGNTATATFKAQVPHSQSGGAAVDSGAVYTVTR